MDSKGDTLTCQRVWKALSELDFLSSGGLWDGIFGIHSSSCNVTVTELRHKKDFVTSIALRALALSHWVLGVLSELVYLLPPSTTILQASVFPSVNGNICIILTDTICVGKMK